ncbi:MAG: cytochrome c oxidase subunit II [Marinilabiliales bacterium]|nr:cytochrome c oxidase subunit II [Marinilabiliales bacterium]
METLFNQGSNLAGGVDRAFIFIFSIAIFFTVGITALMIYILVHYSRKKNKNPQQFSGNTKLEIAWTVIPLIIVLVMFYLGWSGFAPMRKVPADAMQVKVIGRMWTWDFDYGNGKISKELVVPYQKDVKLNLFSADVNHSLFIPAFRVKEDVIPGYNNYLWFRPIKKGTFDIYCSEYCGLAHSGMVAKVVVMDSLEFKGWLANLKATGNQPEHPGLALLKSNTCLTCHSLDGSKIVGPSFKGLFGRKSTVVTDAGEKEIVADEAYIRRSIEEPNAEVVKGYMKGLMQPYKGKISEADLNTIVDFFKSENAKQ